MSLLNLGLAQGVSTVQGTAGQILANGLTSPQNGNVVLTLDGSLSGATGLYNVLTGMSGALVSQIQSAAGVLSLNNATGLLTLTSAPANANYVKVTTSGTTIMVSGDTTPLLSGVTFGGGGQIVGSLANTLSVIAQVITTSGLYMGRTGDYTPSGAASIAQLLATSGWLTNSASSNVVYTTGNQTINGVKTFNALTSLAGGLSATSGLFSQPVGIGTTAPATRLHVVGGITGGALSGTSLVNAGASTLVGTTTIFGDVGIGAAPAANYKLYVLSPYNQGMVVDSTPGNSSILIKGSQHGRFELQDTTATTNYQVYQTISDGGNFEIRRTNDAISVVLATPVTINNDNVGIMTTTPATRLHVVGVGRFDAGAIGSGFYIYPQLTGDYTRSGAASVAQLIGVSGWLSNNTTLKTFGPLSYAPTITNTNSGTITLTASSNTFQILTGIFPHNVQLPPADMYGASVSPSFIIKTRSSGIVSVIPSGLNMIDGTTGVFTLGMNASISLISNGLNEWEIV